MIQTIKPHYYACQTNNTIVNVDQRADANDGGNTKNTRKIQL